MINLVLFIFNMLPVPMLDGWTVYEYFVPQMSRVEPQTRSIVTFVVLILAIATPAFTVLFMASAQVTAVIAGVVEKLL